jgi:hypothetical protein
MGWGSRSMGQVETCELNCGHSEMLREPHVRLIGQTLGNRLQAIRNSALWELSSDPHNLFDSRTRAETAAWQGAMQSE